MRSTRTLIFAASALAALLANCTDDSASPGALDAGLPSALDASTSKDAGNLPDVSETQDGSGDVKAADVQADASDGGPDSADAADAADAAPVLDDSGCPVPTGAVANAADAGLPSSGIALWLRGDLGVAARGDGGVCRWDDVSGNGRAFAPGTAAPPAFAPAAIKGKPGVTFSGDASYLIRNDVLGIAGTSGRTVAVFAATADTTHRFQFFEQGKPGTPGTYFGLDMNTFQTSGSKEGVYVTNNAYDSNVATSTAARSQILSISSFTAGGALPGVLAYSVDGTAATLTRTAGGLGNGTVENFTTADTTYIGTGNAAFTGATLGEMVVYDRALTALERTAVENYFKARFP